MGLLIIHVRSKAAVVLNAENGLTKAPHTCGIQELYTYVYMCMCMYICIYTYVFAQCRSQLPETLTSKPHPEPRLCASLGAPAILKLPVL